MIRRLLLAAAAAAPLAALAQRTPPSTAPAPPTLVVFLTVDQMRADYFARFLPQLTGGLGRLYRQGAVMERGYQDHAITETAPGHSTVLSGRFPRHTGIVANAAGVLDFQTPLVGAPDTGASPFRFRGTTLIDWMRVSDWRSRALSVSRKDRAAILPIGRAHQTAVWFVANGNFATSAYYADTLPTWLTEFNARRLPLSFIGKSWEPLLPDSAYPEPDTVKFESGGKDYVFPHKLPGDSTVTRALAQTPWMDQLTLEVALAGVRAMKLGAGPQPDLLAVSLSTTDAIGHRYGPDSKELHDQILRLDRYLGAFLDTLFSLRDSSRVVIALTADHGVAPLPEVHSGRYPNQGAGYVNLAGFSEYIRQSLPRHGVDTTAWRFAEGVLYLDKSALRAGGFDPDSLARVFAANARTVPGVARTDFVRTLARRDTVHDFIARRWFHMFPDDLVAAEMVITLKPYWYWGEPGGSASHGSPYDYDAWVPVIFYGPPFKPGHYGGVARVVDMAPTLAAVLGVRPSETLDGHVLRQVLRASERTASSRVAAAR